MAKYGLTIFLAALLAVLGAYLYFVEIPAERTKLQTEARERKLLPFAGREVTGLTLRTSAEGQEIVLAPGDGRTWKITAPVQTDADTREVDALLRALTLGNVTRVVEDQASSLAPFGLEQPSLVLTIAAGSELETLLLGDIGPISSTLYAMRASDRKVLLTDLPPKILLGKTLTNFRKKEVVPFEQHKIDRLRLANPKTEVVLERLGDKDKARWQVRFPVEAKADQAEVRNLLIKLEDLKALSFVDPGPERDRLAKRLTRPLVRITASTGTVDQTLKLYQPDPSSGEAYAVTSPEAPIYKVNPIAIQALTKDLFALRDKRLLGLETEEIAKLTVKTREDHYVLIRQNAEWALEAEPGKKLDQQAAAVFVNRVADLPAELRVVKQRGPLTPYGLASPAAEFKAITKDGQITGKLILGNKTGGLVYALGSGLPGIYQARADLLDQIPTQEALFDKAEKQSS